MIKTNPTYLPVRTRPESSFSAKRGPSRQRNKTWGETIRECPGNSPGGGKKEDPRSWKRQGRKKGGGSSEENYKATMYLGINWRFLGRGTIVKKGGAYLKAEPNLLVREAEKEGKTLVNVFGVTECFRPSPRGGKGRWAKFFVRGERRERSSREV